MINNYKNLEWVTLEENMKHAWINNLVNTNKIVLVRNILTNEVREITKQIITFSPKLNLVKINLKN